MMVSSAHENMQQCERVKCCFNFYLFATETWERDLAISYLEMGHTSTPFVLCELCTPLDYPEAHDGVESIPEAQ